MKYFAKALANVLVSSALVAAASGAYATSGSTSNVNVDHITQTGKALSSGKNTQKMEIGNALNGGPFECQGQQHHPERLRIGQRQIQSDHEGRQCSRWRNLKCHSEEPHPDEHRFLERKIHPGSGDRQCPWSWCSLERGCQEHHPVRQRIG